MNGANIQAMKTTAHKIIKSIKDRFKFFRPTLSIRLL